MSKTQEKAFDISTHSLTRRLTGRRRKSSYGDSYFNSQPHKEADLNTELCNARAEAFQLTASQGG